MKLTATSRWFKLDWGIIITCIILITISLATLYSLELNQENPNFSFLNRQMISAAIGVLCFFILLRIDYRYFKDYTVAIYAGGILLLIAVIFFGVEIRGTKGWIDIAGITIQPVEFLKIALILVLARFFSQQNTYKQWRIIGGSLSIALISSVLVLLQPDLGSMAVLMAIWFGMLFVKKVRFFYLVLILLFGLLIAGFSWHYFLKPYQKERIAIFLDPGADHSSAGYNVRQSKIAVGSGRLWGRGLGLGTQSTLKFLPAQETDFIFAVISESLGFLGGMLIIALYSILLWRVLNLSMEIQDEFGTLFGVGLFFWFGFQGFANIAMNIGIAPVFGVPIPFLSYGGSSLLASMFAIGILESVSLYSRREAKLHF